jgi:hypothetical protein
MLSGTAQAAPAGVKGFDVNRIINDKQADAFWNAGFRFALRYVGREAMDPKKDLSTQEAEMLLSKGFALMPVQHVLKGEWMPTASLGSEYGANAARFSQQIGFPPGVNVWLDLESVNTNAAAADVIAYCNNWYAEVAGAGYVPGVYIGWQPGLTSQHLYANLKFQHYWKAYNADANPQPRGYQLIQSSSSVPVGEVGGDYDVDTTETDGRGGQVLWLKV